MEKLTTSAAQLIRYLHPGLMLALFASFLYPAKTWEIFSILGPIIGPLVLFHVGGLIYLAYHTTIAEHFILPYTCSSSLKLLKELGVPEQEWQNARRLIRRDFLPEERQKQWNMAYTETHMLYMTAFTSLIAGVSAAFAQMWVCSYILAFVTLMFAIVGIKFDLRQDIYASMSLRGEKSLSSWLNERIPLRPVK
jgi:hypothetical protein